MILIIRLQTSQQETVRSGIILTDGLEAYKKNEAAEMSPKHPAKQPVEGPNQCLVGCRKKTAAFKPTHDFIWLNTQHVNQSKVCGVCKASAFKAAANEYYAIICNGLTKLSENLTDLTFTQVHLDPNPFVHVPDTCEPVTSTQVRTRHCVWLKRENSGLIGVVPSWRRN